MRTQIFVGYDKEKNAPKNLENVVGDFFLFYFIMKMEFNEHNNLAY